MDDRKIGPIYLVLTFAFSVIFSYVSLYLTVDLPVYLNQFLYLRIGEPPVTLSHYSNIALVIKGAESNLVLDLTWIPFVILLLVLVSALIQKRTNRILGGTIAYFLPTLAHYTYWMGNFMGIGIFRCLWGPWVRNLNQYGWVISKPIEYYAGSTLPIGLGIDDIVIERVFELSDALIICGFFVFTFGVFNFLVGRLMGRPLVDFWIYRYVRHPQYLGFLIWSYGAYARTTIHGWVMGANWPDPIVFVISSLMIIGLALYEEQIETRKSPEYNKYREKTYFMIPFPRLVSRILLIPFSSITGKDYPESRADILVVLGMIFCLTAILSLTMLPNPFIR